MIIIDGPQNVFGNIGHVEEAKAQPLAREAATFFDRGLQSFKRQMVKQIMDEAKVEGLIPSVNIKDVAGFKFNCRKERVGVFHVLLAKIKPGIIDQRRNAIAIEKPKIVG